MRGVWDELTRHCWGLFVERTIYWWMDLSDHRICPGSYNRQVLVLASQSKRQFLAAGSFRKACPILVGLGRDGRPISLYYNAGPFRTWHHTIARFLMLKIENLHATVGDTEILKGLSLTLNAGEIHAIMGPNGAGKSTLAYALGGRPGYEVTEGSATFDGQDLLALDPHDRAAAGIFLGFQYPVEIPGVSNLQFLRESLNAQRKARGEEALNGAEFIKLAKEKAALLKMDMDMLKRAVNVGFSGGEKKRNEMVQMGILDPKLAILDETDSGLDIDALRTVGSGINAIMRKPDKAVLLITHYQRLLDEVKPDFVHVLANGRIVKTGGPELALQLENEGYEAIAEAA